jgi:hypothetical protein
MRLSRLLGSVFYSGILDWLFRPRSEREGLPTPGETPMSDTSKLDAPGTGGYSIDRAIGPRTPGAHVGSRAPAANSVPTAVSLDIGEAHGAIDGRRRNDRPPPPPHIPQQANSSSVIEVRRSRIDGFDPPPTFVGIVLGNLRERLFADKPPQAFPLIPEPAAQAAPPARTDRKKFHEQHEPDEPDEPDEVDEVDEVDERWTSAAVADASAGPGRGPDARGFRLLHLPMPDDATLRRAAAVLVGALGVLLIADAVAYWLVTHP